jgi:hypothetical protein
MLAIPRSQLPTDEASLRQALVDYLDALEAHKETVDLPKPWPEFDILFSIVEAGHTDFAVVEDLPAPVPLTFEQLQGLARKKIDDAREADIASGIAFLEHPFQTDQPGAGRGELPSHVGLHPAAEEPKLVINPAVRHAVHLPDDRRRRDYWLAWGPTSMRQGPDRGRRHVPDLLHRKERAARHESPARHREAPFPGSCFVLGVYPPRRAGVVHDGLGGGAAVSRAFCYTFVTPWGEESAPSPASAVVNGLVTGTVDDQQHGRRAAEQLRRHRRCLGGRHRDAQRRHRPSACASARRSTSPA